ncbi:DUF1700 domain-containing protein [Methanoplanus sp. FWC-SCC4]|uniref:DUF1700 domain-containing protein n=1 Tax=Methanochimaera problematica TaxID=2609417 RepID=A0AA97I2I8_9EURY|nr:DUF1700 domain-containing protein [Methanoplanus sp. FWC-SCC4]WOF15658.1 DUF1700 domain-containing protein [Methanoplanus sp. FWC-SCC4]
MEKYEFFEILKENLARLPVNEVQEIVSDYEEHFAFGLEAGRPEEEICEALGNPADIGKNLVAVSYIDAAERSGSLKSLFCAGVAAVGLGFFNILFALAPVVVFAGIILSIFMIGISFVLAGGIVVFFTVLPEAIPPGATVSLPFNTFFANIAASVGFMAGGILITMCGIYVTRFFVRIMARYFRMNASIIKGAYKNDF